MLSPGLRQVLESLPSRIPLAVEVLDRTLHVVAPDPAARSLPLLDTTGELRERLLASITSGRPQTTVQGGQRISIFPIAVGGERSCTAVLAIAADESESALVEAWGPLLRAAVESDLAAVATTTRQLQQARHMGAVLRFVQHLAGATRETEILRATIQAAAVWFDLDARIYRRTSSGEFVPHMYLPGAPIESERSIAATTIDGIRDALRVTSVADLDALGLSGDGAVLMPIGPAGSDLALVLAGSLPADVELTFGAITRVAAHLLQRARTRTAADVRKALLAVLADTSATPDLTLAQALILLADRCGASSGTVMAHGRQVSKTLAVVGRAIASFVPVADGEAHVTAAGNCIAMTLTAGPDLSVAIELGHPARDEFDQTTRYAFERAGEMLQAWISGVSASAEGRRALLGLAPAESNGFLARIDQEIARAKRFSLHLALVVVRGPNPFDDPTRAEHLLQSVRAELRESDVLGALSPAEVSALLIQTESHGADAVVRRLQRRLADDSTSTGGLTSIGHAVLSGECVTAAALLSQARSAEATRLAAISRGKDSVEA
jgi:hypothetical protein